MPSKTIFIIAGAIAAVAAAFAGGYLINRQPQQPMQQVAQAPANAPVTQGPTAEPTNAAAESQQPASQPAPSYQQPYQRPLHRHHDYADREYESAPPPPPPPPREYAFESRPDYFEGRFAQFPMRHEGDGTIDSPLSFVSQTTWGENHEADLRVSIVVPEPRASDRGEFWREWGVRDHVDLMPEITRGTPVIVTGSAAAIVGIDPAAFNLEVPATLLLRGPDGVRIYRSRDVAPARGATWDSRGVRWLFEIDEDFYRMLRDGADATLAVRTRGREDGRDVEIPFSTDGFQDAARAFEWHLRRRIGDIAQEWQRASAFNGEGPPPQQAYNNTPPPSPNYGPAPQPGYTNPARSGQGSASAQNGLPNGAPAQSQSASTPKVSPPAPSPTPPAPSSRVASTSTPPGAPGPAVTPSKPPATSPGSNAPPAATAKPAAPGATNPPAVTASTSPAATTQADAAKAVAEFHPPTDNCGTAPAFAAADPKDYRSDTPAQLDQADAAAAKVQTWLGCRQQFVISYQSAIQALRLRVQADHAALMTLPGGQAVVADLQTARRTNAEQERLYKMHVAMLARARARDAGKSLQAPAGNPTPQ